MTRSTAARVILPMIALCALAAACRSLLDLDERPSLPEPGTDSGEPSDARTAPDVGPRFCSTVMPTPEFCADFEGESLKAGFENEGTIPDPGISNGGEITPQLHEPRSGLRAARFALPTLLTQDDEASAFLYALTPIRASKLLVKLSLRIDTEAFVPDAGGIAILCSLEFGRDVGRIWISRTSKGMRLSVFDALKSVNEVEFSAAFPVGVWKTITILLSKYPVDGGAGDGGAGNAGFGAVSVVVDGPVAKLPVPASYQSIVLEPRLHIGTLLARGPMGPLELSIDDVWMTPLP